ncbi:AAL067Wp [Eremothecium gossypii ATCC 10895]|uniref:Large ribosomal subunit protein mL67 n=1 Tax=Eremothecium gossypii (strain ATCC 10895 / CBS 109.51 / FGSC 9923 / NRRL Y-1056) TaxID=284811 RepID=MHR1_EREGS|nr:AAL067Wp [Eremothecium gossypii ATCC 10895]Q75EZ5.1 RecName: Full=Large ribosomal subunit protein mL67; AltName: Full=Mitochondrial homologous recombination protein 1 [Eremothecium gossypii ATCC 10895]AAS50299.1 AAL067Wp [Eremothecium gossypii ATCC 10895]AEY94585.1 FAAL067Wp [Eremothecium gossypii FDAG1]
MSKTVGASRFRPAGWLQRAGYAPQVFVFRNLESGQVIYSQLPTFTERQINKNFYRPNWENRKPSTRPDIWKCMAVVDLASHEESVRLYQNLCRLRYLREVPQRKAAEQLRKRNEFGHIWYSAQYRPTYTQEAVADLRECLLRARGGATVHWEDPWRMGDRAKHWAALPAVQHQFLPRMANVAREESAILKQLGERAKRAFAAPAPPAPAPQSL